MRLATITIEVDIDALRQHQPTLAKLMLRPPQTLAEIDALTVAIDLFEECIAADAASPDGA